jgi:hypothetical protein
MQQGAWNAWMRVGLLLSLITVGCADNKAFNKDAIRQTEQPAGAQPYAGDEATPGEVAPEATPEAEAPMDPSMPTPPVIPTEDKTALDECLKQWTKPPFTPEQIARPKVVEISQTNNNNAIVYTDQTTTAAPTLYLLNFNINVGNQGTLELKNARGWYCLNVKAKVINNFTLNVACETQVAIVTKSAQNDNNFQIVRDPCP